MLTVTVAHDNLTAEVQLFRNGAKDFTQPVSTLGQAGSVAFVYDPTPTGVSEFKAKAANSEGESPFSASAVFIAGIPSAPSSITFTIG